MVFILFYFLSAALVRHRAIKQLWSVRGGILRGSSVAQKCIQVLRWVIEGRVRVAWWHKRGGPFRIPRAILQPLELSLQFDWSMHPSGQEALQIVKMWANSYLCVLIFASDVRNKRRVKITNRTRMHFFFFFFKAKQRISRAFHLSCWRKKEKC